MRRYPRGLSYYDIEGQRNDIGKYLFPYTELESFTTDSSDMDLGLTLINIQENDKCQIINCFNQNGIIKTYKKNKPKTLTEVTRNVE